MSGSEGRRLSEERGPILLFRNLVFCESNLQLSIKCNSLQNYVPQKKSSAIWRPFFGKMKVN